MKYFRVDLMWSKDVDARVREVQKRLRKLPARVSRSLVSRKAIELTSTDTLVEAITNDVNRT